MSGIGPFRLLVTCEHGGNRIPVRYRSFFRRHRQALESHRGYDPGALAYARDLAAAFDAELVYSTTSRLLVELNRSLHHPTLFSEVTRALPCGERSRIVERYYLPYREWIATQAAAAKERGEHLLHLSCHSFTPRLHGVVRTADIGLLYDPKRPAEVHFCRVLQRTLQRAVPHWRVRRNYPYRGTDDGLTTSLRKRFAANAYSGIELEVNQKYPLGDAQVWHTARKALVESLRQALTAL